MEKFSFFNDVNDDRVYYAEDWARHLKKYFTNGIFNNELSVLANNDMTITIKEGDANIEGYRYTNTGDLVKTIDNADGTLNRIDNVVLRLDLTNRLISAQIIKGTFADKPVAPELVRTSTIYDLRLAKISIPAGTTTITQDLITDTRFITSDCGNVISTVQTPDTENLFIQMQTLFEKQINELNNNFETWFDSMKNQLSSDAAGNLQNQINNLNSNKADNATYDPNSKNLQLSANGKNVGDSVHIPTGITDTATGEEDLKIVNNKGVVKFSLDGKTVQNSYTGKNIFDYITNLLTSENGLTNTINTDKSITTTGTPTKDFAYITKDYVITDMLEDGQTYTISQAIASNKLYLQINARKKSDKTYIHIAINSDNVKSKSFKVDKSTYDLYSVNIQTTTMSLWGSSSLTITNKYMLCKGTDTAYTSFEPYCGGQSSPNPDYPSKIENVRGVENLLKLSDETYESNGITAVIKDGVITLNGTATARSMITISLSTFKSGSYTIAANNEQTIGAADDSSDFAACRIAYTNGSVLRDCYLGKKNSTANFIISNDININFTIRTAANLTYNNFVIKPQLEQGSIVHDFVPYGSNYLQLKNTTDNESKTINIDLKGNELCSDKEQMLKDELIIENGRAKIIKKYDEVILDGTEDWNISSNNPNQTNTIYGSSNKLDTLVASASKLTSNYFTYVRDLWNGDVEGIYFDAVNKPSLRIRINKTKVSTATEFKTWLKSQYDSGNPVKVQYELAESQTIDLGEVDLDLLEGNSTLNVEEELKPTISVKYYTDENVIALRNEVVKKQNKVLSGTSVPSSSLGEDGDVYFQYSS